MATVNLGPARRRDGRQRAARRLRPHRGGVDLVGCAVRRLRGRRRSAATRRRSRPSWCILLAAMNLRGMRESGNLLRRPDLRLHGGHPRHVRLRADAACRRRPAEGRERRPGHRAGAWLGGTLTTFALLFLLARAFSSGCAALTGVEAISNGVPAFRRPKSRNAATTLLLLGVIAITMMLSVIVLANQMGLRYVDPHDLDRLTLDGEPLPAGLRPARRDRPDRPGGLHRLLARLLLRGHRDRRDPGARGQHGVQRLPGAGLDPRPGRLRAPGARLARRPAGLQQRHRLPRR